MRCARTTDPAVPAQALAELADVLWESLAMSLPVAFSLSSSFALALVSASAFGGPVVQAEMTASAQMQVQSGMLDGCGLRVVAVANDQSTTVTAIDFSFNFYHS